MRYKVTGDNVRMLASKVLAEFDTLRPTMHIESDAMQLIRSKLADLSRDSPGFTGAAFPPSLVSQRSRLPSGFGTGAVCTSSRLPGSVESWAVDPEVFREQPLSFSEVDDKSTEFANDPDGFVEWLRIRLHVNMDNVRNLITREDIKQDSLKTMLFFVGEALMGSGEAHSSLRADVKRCLQTLGRPSVLSYIAKTLQMYMARSTTCLCGACGKQLLA